MNRLESVPPRLSETQLLKVRFDDYVSQSVWGSSPRGDPRNVLDADDFVVELTP